MRGGGLASYKGNMFITNNLQIIWFEHSNNAINFSRSQVTVWFPGHHQGRVPSHQSQGQPLEELLDSHSLQNALVASYSYSNPLHLLYSHLVEAAQSLNGDWEDFKMEYCADLAARFLKNGEGILTCLDISIPGSQADIKFYSASEWHSHRAYALLPLRVLQLLP